MPREPASTWRFPLLVLVAGFVGVAWLGAQPRSGQPVAAVFPPWWSFSQVYGAAATADGDVLRTGAWPALVVAYSPDPTFPARLHAAGAWFVLDALQLGICGANKEDLLR